MLRIFPRLITLIAGFVLLAALLIPQLLWADDKGQDNPFLSKFSVNAFVDGSDRRWADPNLGLQYQFLKTPGPQGGITGSLRLLTSSILDASPDKAISPRFEILFRF